MTIPSRVGCPIRISTDQSLLAAPHGFSQRATSFIASWCQGIHRMPLSYSNPRHVRGRSQNTPTMHGNHRQTGVRGEPTPSNSCRRRISIIFGTGFIVQPSFEEDGLR